MFRNSYGFYRENLQPWVETLSTGVVIFGYISVSYKQNVTLSASSYKNVFLRTCDTHACIQCQNTMCSDWHHIMDGKCYTARRISVNTDPAVWPTFWLCFLNTSQPNGNSLHQCSYINIFTMGLFSAWRSLFRTKVSNHVKIHLISGIIYNVTLIFKEFVTLMLDISKTSFLW